MNRTIAIKNPLAAMTFMFVVVFFADSAHAQHFTHTYRYTGDVEIEHIPDHDEVLPALPENLVLRFSDHVSLVKLVVKTDQEKVVDIQFRYNPVPDRVFLWSLPQLPASAWYSVDWGAIDRTNKLMSGQFKFSAGPDAKKPSELVPEVDEDHIMVPDYRLLNLQDYQPVSPQN